MTYAYGECACCLKDARLAELKITTCYSDRGAGPDVLMACLTCRTGWRDDEHSMLWDNWRLLTPEANDAK